jgi:hypothetical protein
VRAFQAAASTRAADSSLIVHDMSNNLGYAVLHKVRPRLNPNAVCKSLCSARVLARCRRRTVHQVLRLPLLLLLLLLLPPPPLLLPPLLLLLPPHNSTALQFTQSRSKR